MQIASILMTQSSVLVNETVSAIIKITVHTSNSKLNLASVLTIAMQENEEHPQNQQHSQHMQLQQQYV